jgi:hypothetical protein
MRKLLLLANDPPSPSSERLAAFPTATGSDKKWAKVAGRNDFKH